MPLPCYQIDSFTEEPLLGNPAAVVVLDRMREDLWLQRVAGEMNLSETAFLLRQAAGSYQLRWFTPTVEVDLCGHATLAAACALWEFDHESDDTKLTFDTRSGQLFCELSDDWIEMDFPTQAITPIEDATSELAHLALEEEPVFVGQTQHDLIVHLHKQEDIKAFVPDLKLLARLPHKGIVITAKALNAEHDYVCRFFGPKIGIDEDPVTGAAHAVLGPYWAQILGKRDVLGYQASARGGFVRVVPRGERVTLGGHAVPVLKGELLA